MKSSSRNKCSVPNGSRPQPGAAIFNRRSFVKYALAVTAAAACFCGGRVAVLADRADHFNDAFGPLYQAASPLPVSPRHGPRQGLDSVRRWNQIAIDASGLDHTPVAPGENRVFGEQIGPCRASRAMAIVHIAMFDTVNAVVQEYESYTGVRAPFGALSMPAAISQAVHDTLAALVP